MYITQAISSFSHVFYSYISVVCQNVALCGNGLKHLQTKINVAITFGFAFNPLPDDKILDWSKLKQSADDNFEFDVNSRKFSKQEENTVGKGEIAHYEQFLLFPYCF